MAARVTRRPWLQGLLVAPVWLLLLTALDFPFDWLAQRVDLRYGLSVQSWISWLADLAKATALSLIFGTVALSVLYALMRRSPRRWWLWFWLLTLPVEVLGVFAMPVLIDPLFNHFQPLAQADPALVEQLERVAARGHMEIPPQRMFVMDASSKVTGLNAYVTGFGASKRIVVWDTTLQKAPMDEILFIYGHEQGHYALHHIVIGLLYSAAVILVFYWLGYRMIRRMIRWRGDAWHIHSPEDWASITLLFLVITLLGVAAEPAANVFSRWEEHQADIYGQEVVHGIIPDPQQTAVRSFDRLGTLWLDVPYPDRFVEFWTYSHPSTEERAEFAAHYDPWRPGEHPKYFAK